MRVFIAVATSSDQNVKSLKSCFTLARQKGDDLFFPDQYGPGLQTRVAFEAEFLARKEYDAILMLDGDQVHPENMLKHLAENLLAYNLDMVCAHYYRRSTSPVESLCYELGDGTFPFMPMLHPPRSGLHPIALTGMGCVLIKREVVEAVRKVLPKGDAAFGVGPMPGWAADYGTFGQDYRFFLLARQLGYQLWLDADVESLHGVTLWLGHAVAQRLMDYSQWADKAQETLEQERLRIHGVTPEAFRQRMRILEARMMDLRQKIHEAQGNDELLTELSPAYLEMGGRIKEMQAWIQWAEKYPTIERPDQLPTTENMPKQEGVEQVTGPRMDLYQANAMDMMKEVPNVSGA